jgi:NAD-dependent SIR2 family protein deacetylase
MSQDSGLPTFREHSGFWQLSSTDKQNKIKLVDLATPSAFVANAKMAWGFYGQRYNLYKNTPPHNGYEMLLKWTQSLNLKYRVITTNVDGHFQRAGFNPHWVIEKHGSINHLQCMHSPNCDSGIWKNLHSNFDIDDTTLSLKSSAPQCPDCGMLARPNIYMFDDYEWDCSRLTEKNRYLNKFIKSISPQETVVLEIGAGNAIPTIRQLSKKIKGHHIRINPEALPLNDDKVEIRKSALHAIKAIDSHLNYFIGA